MKKRVITLIVLFAALPCFARYVDVFDEASRITGIPRETLIGIAYVESGFDTTAIGDGGRSHGMFQINEDYHLERTWIMGRDYDPHDIYDAAVLTGKLYRRNLRATKSKAMAVAAHKQGLHGVREHGVCQWYVNEVAFWGRVYSSKKIMVWVE